MDEGKYKLLQVRVQLLVEEQENDWCAQPLATVGEHPGS